MGNYTVNFFNFASGKIKEWTRERRHGLVRAFPSSVKRRSGPISREKGEMAETEK